MMLRTAIVALLLFGSVGMSAQGRRGPRDDRYRDAFGLSADAWCRDAGRGNNRSEASCDVWEESLGNVPSLDVDSGGNGGIRVRGVSGSTTRVRFRVVGHARDERDARELVRDVRITTDGGRIRVTGPRGQGRRDEWWNVDLEIEAPRELTMTLTTSNGGISLEGVAGRTRFDTTNGGVSLQDVAGDVRGRTVNGGLNIALEGSRWRGEGLDVQTTNGGVRMELPAGYNAQLHTETHNGGIDIDFPITVSGRVTDLRRRIDTTIGSGGAPLSVRTVNGGVRISRR